MASGPSEPNSEGPVRLLVIDDSALIHLFIEQIFAEDGVEVVCAESGSAGLELAHQKAYDIILCDVLLPDMEGFEVCRRLKSDVVTRRIPIILISTDANAAFVRRGLEVAEEYIGKPLDADALQARVRSMLRQKQMMDEIMNMNKTLDARVFARTEELLLANQRLSLEIAVREKSEAAVKELSADLLLAREKEREKIACDLHDDLGQSLLALKLGLQTSLRSGAVLDSTVAQIDSIAEQVRSVSRRLSPIPSGGILEEIHQLIEAFPTAPGTPEIRVVWLTNEAMLLERYWNANVFRVIQEAITNAIRHARAHQIEIRFRRSADVLRITIADDGIGMSQTESGGTGLGLTTMRRRIVAESGSFWIESEPGETEVNIEVKI